MVDVVVGVTANGEGSQTSGRGVEVLLGGVHNGVGEKTLGGGRGIKVEVGIEEVGVLQSHFSMPGGFGAIGPSTPFLTAL